MAKKYEKVWENASKMMPKRCPKPMTSLWIFRTCDFLIFAKGITLKSFFYMIRGTRNPSKIHNKSMQNRCSKKVCRKHETYIKKWSRNGSQNPWKSIPKRRRIFYTKKGPQAPSQATPGDGRGGGAPPLITVYQYQTDEWNDCHCKSVE